MTHRTTRYTDAELRALHAGLRRGDSIPTIAARLGRGYKGLYHRARREGWLDRTRHYLTRAEDDRIAREYPTTPSAPLARAMGLTLSQLHNAAHRLGVRKSAAFFAHYPSGRFVPDDTRGESGRFRPGLTPWNKGRPFHAGGRSADTQFQAGARPHNTRPLGSLRVCTMRNGRYLQRKLTNTGYPPRDWVSVHRTVWETAHGAIPAGHIVCFKPGQHTIVEADITPDKLECIPRTENMRRNSIQRYPPELRDLMQRRGKLLAKLDRIKGTP